MRVSELMTQSVHACSIHDSLARAAQIVWENDCGCIPVVATVARTLAMIGEPQSHKSKSVIPGHEGATA